MSEACFTAADILLPAAGVPLDPWACIAVDQFTSQPEYWQRAEHLADGKPSTLHIVLPEAYLGTPQEAERVASIRRTMEEYRKSVLTRKVHGYVYVERTQMDGTVRQGLVGAVDLDAYDYAKGSKPAIRPSESTVVERIPPRLKVRRGATLETPHVMMLADDADCTLIEPIGLMKNQLPPLYDGELMLGGGHLRGWAVEDPALIAGIDAALAALADPAAFARRWPAAKGQQPMVLAAGKRSPFRYHPSADGLFASFGNQWRAFRRISRRRCVYADPAERCRSRFDEPERYQDFACLQRQGAFCQSGAGDRRLLA